MGSSPLIGKTEAVIFSAAVGVIVYPMLPKRAVAVELMTHAVARPLRSEAVQARIIGPVACAPGARLASERRFPLHEAGETRES